MKNAKIIKIIKAIILMIVTYFSLMLINNLRNIINILMNNNKNITFISMPIIISLIIFLYH